MLAWLSYWGDTDSLAALAALHPVTLAETATSFSTKTFVDVEETTKSMEHNLAGTGVRALQSCLVLTSDRKAQLFLLSAWR